MSQTKHDAQDWKVALAEASLKALERRTADIAARHAVSMIEPDDDFEDDTLDFGQLIKNTSIGK